MIRPRLPYRVSFLCPTIDVDGHDGDVLCEIVLQWLALQIVQNDKLVVVPPERFPATVDGVRMTHDWCEAEEGLSERYMHARIDEVLWLEIDTKSRTCRLLSRRFARDIDAHGSMSGPFTDVVGTLLSAWASSRSLGSVVDVRDRQEWHHLENAAGLWDELVAAIDAGDVNGAFSLSKKAGAFEPALLGAAVRCAAITPDDRLLEASAPRTVKALKGDALSYAYFAWSLAPDDAHTILLLADMLSGNQRHTEAHRMADRAARIVPSLVEAHTLCVRSTLALGRPGEAYAEALERLALIEDAGAEPGEPFIEALRGAREAVGLPNHESIIAYHRGDVGHCARAEDISPLLKARALLTLERAEAAREILESEAKDVQSLLTLAEAWAFTGREAQSLWLMQHVALRAPQERHGAELGRLLRVHAGFAIAHFERAIEVAPSPVLKRALARDAADAHPDAKSSAIVLAALGTHKPARYSEVWLDPLREGLGAERAARLDRLFVVHTVPTLAESDRLLGMWHAVIERFASEIGIPNPDNPDLAPTLTYVAAQAVGRYLAGTTGAPNPTSLAFRQIALECLLAARIVMLDAEEAVLLLHALEPALACADPELADEWLGRVERAFDLELVLGAHTDTYAEGLDSVSALFLGDEHLGALHAQASTSADFLRLARHTGVWKKAGDAWIARFIADPLAVISEVFPAPEAFEAPQRAEVFETLEASDMARAQLLAAKAVALDPEDWSAWHALTLSSNYRPHDTGNDLPPDGLKLARSVMDLSQGSGGASAGRLRIYASRIIESRGFALDRVPPVE